LAADAKPGQPRPAPAPPPEEIARFFPEREILELLVVIAIIAILAALLLPAGAGHSQVQGAGR
jgi:hypothetical protein